MPLQHIPQGIEAGEPLKAVPHSRAIEALIRGDARDGGKHAPGSGAKQSLTVFRRDRDIIGVQVQIEILTGQQLLQPRRWNGAQGAHQMAKIRLIVGQKGIERARGYRRRPGRPC